MRPRPDGGYASVLVVGMALVAIAVAGVAIDGTRAFLLRRSLQNAADAAALAGASEIDRDAYYSSGGRSVSLDAQAARATAARWLALRGMSVDTSIATGEDALRVSLRQELDTTFLKVVGIGAVPVGAESTAQPMAGDG